MSAKIRKLKDDAQALLREDKLQPALEIYERILGLAADDPTALQKSAEILRRLDRNAEAVQRYLRLSELCANDGLLLKAIAACKVAVEVAPQDPDAQAMLAELYVRQVGRARKPATTSAEPPFGAAPSAEIPLFSDLPKNAFVELLEQMRLQDAAPGEVIIRQGDPDTSMYVISSGRVRVTRRLAGDEELVVAELAEGSFFGEMAHLLATERSATVTALESTMLFVVQPTVLEDIARRFPGVKKVLQHFFRRRLLSNFVATAPMFRPLDEAQRVSLMEHFRSRWLEPGEVVLAQGQRGDGLYVVLAGEVDVTKTVGVVRHPIDRLRAGDIFGEMSLLHGAPVSADVRVSRRTILLKLPREKFPEVASTHPQLLEYLSNLSDTREQFLRASIGADLRRAAV